jgi:hypothetical protein
MSSILPDPSRVQTIVRVPFCPCVAPGVSLCPLAWRPTKVTVADSDPAVRTLCAATGPERSRTEQKNDGADMTENGIDTPHS